MLEGTDSVAINGNVFSGLTEKAVTLKESPQGIVFAGNVLTDVESQHAGISTGVVADNHVAD